jgi:hypothetical protein
MIKGVPRPVSRPVNTPDKSNKILYGEYLTTIGTCEGCHTPFERGSFDMTHRLAGGRKFMLNGYQVVSSNLTPDPDTGIGDWSLDYFKQRFYRFREYRNTPFPAVTSERFTIMPWLSLSKLTPEDLEAIYAYLMSRRPIRHRVTVHPIETATN